MDRTIERALQVAIAAFAQQEKLDQASFTQASAAAFASPAPFMEKVGLLDAAFDDQPVAQPLREVFFDLLLVNFFTEDVRKLEADYLDSPEWEAIEDETLDRGTELLNLLLYLNECSDEGIDPGLSDYLNEFLLVDEDEFQDEHHIYEEVIANQALAESSYADIAAVAAQLPDDSELKDLFYPMLSFFLEQDPEEAQFETYLRSSTAPGFDAAIYGILTTFKKHRSLT